MVTIVKSSEVAKFGVWTAPFYLSSGFEKMRDLTPDEIVSRGQDALDSSSDYELDEMYKFVIRKKAGRDTFILKTRAEMQGNFTVRDMVSANTETKLWKALKAKSIVECTTVKSERLLVSVLVVWLRGIMSSPNRIEEALNKMDSLRAELKELEDYLLGNGLYLDDIYKNGRKK